MDIVIWTEDEGSNAAVSRVSETKTRSTVGKPECPLGGFAPLPSPDPFYFISW